MDGENILIRGVKNIMPTGLFLRWQYYKKTGRKLNLKEPKTFNEKIHWMKVNYRNKQLHQLVDKYEVRKYVKEKIGGEYLNEVYGIYDHPSQINPENLPKSFVLKGTHGSGMVLICKDKSYFDWDEAIKYIKKWLRTDWYSFGREWAYKNIKRRVICEKLLLDGKKIPNDYKFYCFHGDPKFIEVTINRFGEIRRNCYDPFWNQLPINDGTPNSETKIERPTTLDKMLKLSKSLSKDFPFVRVDFYEVDDKIIFGELTFYPGRGLELFKPEKYEKEFGNYLKLPIL